MADTALSNQQVFLDSGKIAARLAQLAARHALTNSLLMRTTVLGNVLNRADLSPDKPVDEQRDKLAEALAGKPDLLDMFDRHVSMQELALRASNPPYAPKIPIPHDEPPTAQLALVAITAISKDGAEKAVRAVTPADLEDEIDNRVESMRFRAELLSGVGPCPMMDPIEVITVGKFCQAVLDYAGSIWRAAAELPVNCSAANEQTIAGLRAIFAMRYISVGMHVEALSPDALRDLVSKMQGRIRQLESGEKSILYTGREFSLTFEPPESELLRPRTK